MGLRKKDLQAAVFGVLSRDHRVMRIDDVSCKKKRADWPKCMSVSCESHLYFPSKKLVSAWDSGFDVEGHILSAFNSFEDVCGSQTESLGPAASGSNAGQPY